MLLGFQHLLSQLKRSLETEAVNLHPLSTLEQCIDCTGVDLAATDPGLDLPCSGILGPEDFLKIVEDMGPEHREMWPHTQQLCWIQKDALKISKKHGQTMKPQAPDWQLGSTRNLGPFFPGDFFRAPLFPAWRAFHPT